MFRSIIFHFQLKTYENDVFLVPSGTNLSLLPLEVMACKTLVLSNKGENVEWLINRENSILSETDPFEIAKDLYEIIVDKEKRENLIEKGYEFATSTSWDKEGEKVYNILQSILRNEEKN